MSWREHWEEQIVKAKSRKAMKNFNREKPQHITRHSSIKHGCTACKLSWNKYQGTSEKFTWFLLHIYPMEHWWRSETRQNTSSTQLIICWKSKWTLWQSLPQSQGKGESIQLVRGHEWFFLLAICSFGKFVPAKEVS